MKKIKIFFKFGSLKSVWSSFKTLERPSTFKAIFHLRADFLKQNIFSGFSLFEKNIGLSYRNNIFSKRLKITKHDHV